ncbi:diguanylate cyclase [Synechococcus elongatus]|uniref:Diguanylate cyclase (GGDEF domain) n=1 Tax=Synechococcus elongatus (strain ATCC 33912 / PCC 7942 / FACHB-805) TaxID=1140 RepID=Q31NP1_SYNE7|nr:diguanylate cyclase [Synechococcus elongatus]ABB57328.1 diguanylate cyclase (GGDEF domain) [Synechococcus elongatus PCC 7942 = FACHB-805]AJD58161.1 diguanylate cyclase [Synechococcus elongatus UTEX 2973]MBD2587735.1 diguanylate cyclase [Synechococcus elongatus FACHB-242]MBD2688486.1 diguanylate cyclase [Synechococcus elongatus FACHB-1061]MBD2707557.1 diguanylate cyclase [Synechococcus elongatus PCC 7942 = FACHB-805]
MQNAFSTADSSDQSLLDEIEVGLPNPKPRLKVKGWRSWVYGGAGLLLGVFGIAGSLGLFAIQEARRQVDRSLEAIEVAQIIDYYQIQLLFRFNSYLESRQETDNKLYQLGQEQLLDSIDKLKSFYVQPPNPEQLKEIAALSALIQSKLEEQQNLMNAKQEATPSLDASYYNVHSQINQIVQNERRILDRRVINVDSYRLLTNVLLILGSLLGLTLAIALYQEQRREQREMSVIDHDYQEKEDTLNHKLKVLQLEQKLSSLLLTCRSTEEIKKILEDFFQRWFPQAQGAVLEISASRDTLVEIARFGELELPSLAMPSDCWAMRRGECYHSSQAEFTYPCGLCHHLHGEIIPDNIICIPLQAHEQLIGILHLTNVDPKSQKIVESFGQQLALPLAVMHLQEQLKQLSYRDSNTALYNRRFLDEILERTLLTAIRRNESRSLGDAPYSVGLIFLDVDKFKDFNTRFGHAVGDQVLQTLGQTMLESCRRGEDLACRYGGEEFVLILPGMDEDMTYQRAEQIRLAVSQKAVSNCRITISLGVAAFPSAGQTPSELLKAANMAMLKAKLNGRNQTVRISQL